MSEATDAYIKGWAAGWNMAKHAMAKEAERLLRDVQCGCSCDPEWCETPEHCEEIESVIQGLKNYEK